MTSVVRATILATFVFWTGTTMGAVAFAALLQITGVEWPGRLRREAERFRAALLVSCFIALAFVIGMPMWFAWRVAVAIVAVRQSIAEATAGQKPRGQLDATAFWAAFQKNRQNAEAVLVTTLGRQEHDFDAACVTALMHALAPEPAAVRVGLVKWLSRTLHPEATRALARLALFSAEEEVRLPAIAALQLRRERDYTPILMQGLRYPLPAVARRAAEALVRLDRADVVPQLVALLDEPDPRLPVAEEIKGAKVKVVTELTRVKD